MSVSTLIQSGGFAVLLATDGEALTCPSAVVAASTINAVVNRNIVKGKDFLRMFKDIPVDFDITGLTEISFLISDTIASPQAGQGFVDALGFRHRVRYVTQTDIVYVIYCTPAGTTILP